MKSPWRKKLFVSYVLAALFAVGCTSNSLFRIINTTYFFQDEFSLSDLTPPQNDILFVIDNSASMTDEIDALATSLTTLVQNLEGTDYRVSMITLDNLYNYNNYFANNARIAWTGSLTQGETADPPTPNDFDNVFSFLSGLQSANHQHEPLIGLSVKAIEKIYSENGGGVLTVKNEGNLDNLHVVVLSDENNTSEVGSETVNIKDEYGLKYRYPYRYKTGENELRINSTRVCVANPNVNGVNPNSKNKLISCDDGRGNTGLKPWTKHIKVTRDYDPNNRWATCYEPRDFMCVVTVDNTQLPPAQYGYYVNNTCVPVDPDDLQLILTGNGGVNQNPYRTDCVTNISCVKDAYQAYSGATLNGSNLYEPTYDGCEAGYVEQDGYSHVILDAEGVGLAPVDPLPAGVTAVSDDWIEEVLELDEWVHEDDAFAQIQALHPGASEIELTWYPERPAAPDEIHPAYTNTAIGFMGWWQRYYRALKITFNSMVNLNDQVCDSGNQDNNTKGEDYIELSGLTEGDTWDVCNPQTAIPQLLEDLANTVIINDTESYTLSGIVDESKGFLVVTNLTTGQELPSTDYELINNQFIRFKAGSVTEDAKIRVQFRPFPGVEFLGEGEEGSE